MRPGPYDLAWTPYWREVIDAALEPDVRRLNIVASTQSGKTQAALVILAYIALHRPTNALYVRPAEDDVGEGIRDRLVPMIERNLPELVPAAGSWFTTTKNPYIALTNLTIYGAAATIERQLTSRTAMTVWYDETDTGGDAANQLGNVLDLLDQRQAAGSARHALTIGSSSPRYATGSNWIAYDQRSDRREYWQPCPYCGAFRPHKLAQITAPADCRDPELIVRDDLARYSCEACRQQIGPDLQHWMIDRGRWCPAAQVIAEGLPLDRADIVERRSLATAPEPDRWEPARGGEAPYTRHRGYRIWRAQTKADSGKWSAVLANWLEVNRSKDPERLQVFINSSLAEPWKEAVEPADADLLTERVGAYEPRIIPERALVILGGVDVQAAEIWYLWRAFGPGLESWLIDYGSLEVTADDYPAAFDRVYQAGLVDGWPVAGSTLRQRAYGLAVDSGYRPDEVYEFAKRPGVVATKGYDLANYRVKQTNTADRQGAAMHLWLVNTRTMKDRLQRLLKVPAGQPGQMHLHAKTSPAYFDHLTAEHLAPRPSNPRIRTWQLKTARRPNHLLDCEVGILALAEALEQRREISLGQLTSDADPIGRYDPEPEPAARPDPPAKKPARPRRRRTSKPADFLPRR